MLYPLHLFFYDKEVIGLARPANSRAIQLGAAQSTVTAWLFIRKRRKSIREGYSSGSFALHSAVAVASRMDKSLSTNLSRSKSKRFS